MRVLVGLLCTALSLTAGEKLVVVAESAALKEPFGGDFLPDGSFVFVEYGGNKLTRITSEGKIVPFAGTGKKAYADGPAKDAMFNGPHNCVTAINGTVYVADSLNHRVRKIAAKTGDVSTIAGTGTKGFSGDNGPAKDATFDSTFHVALDRKANLLYVVDLGNRRVRLINLTTGIVTTVAGDGKKGIPEDGAKAIAAPLVDPRACTVDSTGKLYILERGGNALRVVEEGKIRTVVGPAAKMNGPKILTVDGKDGVWIADAENNTIRRYDPTTGKIELKAGTGKKGTAGIGGDPVLAELARPHGIAIAPNGTPWITDSYNSRILKIVRE